MPVVDTDVLTVIQRRQEPDYSRLVSRLNALPSGTPVWTTVVSFEEQLRGWLEYAKRAKPEQLSGAYHKLTELNADFATRPLLPFDDLAQAAYRRLRTQRLRVGEMDLRIAAITLSRNEVLLTKNLRHFRLIPGLRAEDWTR